MKGQVVSGGHMMFHVKHSCAPLHLSPGVLLARTGGGYDLNGIAVTNLQDRT